MRKTRGIIVLRNCFRQFLIYSFALLMSIVWLAVLIGVIVSGIFVGYMYEKADDSAVIVSQSVISNVSVVDKEASARQDEITVTFINSTYESVAERPAGWFTSGQDADIMVSGIDFNNTGGPLLFNHQGNVASDGAHLLLADRNNNRVLIWNSTPTGNSPPDIVLGQENFYANNPGIGLDHMSWPVSVATDGQHVVVADTYNDRVLIWNNFSTLQNGTSADFELKEGIGWPWAVWTNGTKLVVASTACRAVLIWNSFPTSNAPADIFITLLDFGTPRAIASDGNHLVIGDHNAFVNGTQQQGNFFWKTFPEQNNQPYDFFVAEISMMGQPNPPPNPIGSILWGAMTSDGKLIGVANQLYIWNSFPENENDTPDLSVGAGFPGASGYDFGGGQSGDGSGVVVAGGRLYISLSNGNKIVVFNSLPTESDQNPDFAIGASDIYTNTLRTNYFITNPVPVSDGESLFVSSDFDCKLYVWKYLPDESGAKPDIVYNLSFAPWDSALFENTYVLAGRDTVCIWNTLPKAGELPDLWFKGTIGNVTFQDLRGVALDNKYFYLADKTANKIYVWEGIPNNNTTNAKFSIDISMPARLSSDGNYLVVAATEAAFGERIKFYKIDGLSSSTQPILLTGINVNLPEAALAAGGHLFIADTVFNRVLVWNNISDAVNGSHPEIVLGEEDFNDTHPEIGIDKLFWPAALTFDGSYLWVGEFKFSGRVVRFSVKPVSHEPIYIDGNDDFVIGQNGVVSGNGTETNPYIIEGWDINASAAYGIKIENTDVYFIIRNCVIHDGGSNYHGIYFNSVRNGKIDNATSHNNLYGIFLYYSSNDNIITNCSVYNNYYYGLYLYYSSNDTLIDNTFTNNGVVIWGEYLEQYIHNIGTSNTVNDKPLYYYKNQNNLVIDNIAVGQLILVNCTNCNIRNINITNTDVGIELAYSSNNTITNCNVYNNSCAIYLCYSPNNKITNCAVYNNSDCGIHLYSSSSNNITNCVVYNSYYEGICLGYSSNNIITNCYIYNNDYGIRLASSSNNDITSNRIYDDHYGIYLWDSSYNNITDCNVYSNQHGIYLFSSSHDQITYCNITNNTNDGIYIYYWVGFLSNYNIFHHNSFIGNGQNAYDPYTNYWDDGIGEGNYWGDYTGSDADNDWLGDTAYNISGGSNKDSYPLIYPYPVGNSNKSKSYSSIQDAVDDASAGDTIYVWDGTYYENIIINKSISLVGRDRNTTIIDGDGTAVIYISADWVNVSGFSVTNSGSDWECLYTGIAIYYSSNNTISDCNVQLNDYCGISLDGTSNAHISFCNVSNSFHGIELCPSSNNQITNCSVYNNDYGIYLYSSSNNNISNCTVYNNTYGICLDSSSNNKLRNMVLENNTYNFGVLGGNISHYYQDIDISNTINGKSIYYIKEQSSLVFDATMNIGYIGLVSCNNIRIENLTITNNIQGLLLANTSHSTISNCTVHSNYYYGIRLYGSSNNIITDCTIYNNSKGISPDYASNNNTISTCAVYNNTYAIWLYESSNNNIITSCDVYNNSFGIMLSYSSNNNITNCTIYNNAYSIWLEYSSNDNIIANCTVCNNSWGIYLYSSSNNLIYNNYFNNTNNVCVFGGSGNKWNISKTAGTNIISGLYLGGNYWSDYTGCDIDGDGLGDTNLLYGPGDYLPLTAPNFSPVANFTFSPELPTDLETVGFTSTSTDPDDDALTFSWSFGDGITSTLENPAHQYGDDGTYIVNLTVIDSHGASNAISKQITVLNVPPVANFTYTPQNITNLDIVTFTDTSFNPDGSITSWAWNFGDGNTSTLQNPTHRYTIVGNYTVNLTVTDDDGATSNYSALVNISTSIGYHPHAPISINDNAQFTFENGVLSGSGTQADPYILENWDINVSGVDGILIENTDVHFVIRNCTIYNGKSNKRDGIYLYNVINGKIENCHIYNNSNGISLDHSSNNIISVCNVYNNYNGIDLWESSNNTIGTCNISNNYYWYGIYLYHSSNNNIISACNIFNNSYGIYLSSSSNNKFINNTITIFQEYGFYFSSDNDLNNSIDVTNTVNGKKIILLSNIHTHTTISEIKASFPPPTNVTNYGLINLYKCSNITVDNCEIAHTIFGVYLSSSSNCIITNCTVYNNSEYGIYLRYSSNNQITNCTVYNNSWEGIYLLYSSNNQITNCSIYNNSGDGLDMSSCSNNTLSECHIYNNWIGITLSCANGNLLSHNNISWNTNMGINIYDSDNNIITYNLISYNFGIYFQAGIRPHDAHYNIISNNTIYKNYIGLYMLHACSYNVIRDNLIENNSMYGIALSFDCDNNEFRQNDVISNNIGIYIVDYALGWGYAACNDNVVNYNNIRLNTYGIKIDSYYHDSSSNFIFHNNFINNTNNAYDECTNTWDDGSEGNYWSDYTGSDANGDGTGDTAYNIPGGMNKDNYPFTNYIEYLPPTVESPSPSDNGIDVLVNTSIMITFSEPINKLSVPGNITISPEIEIRSYNWSADNRTLTLILISNLLPYTNYTITITTNVKDLSQNNLREPYMFSFRTKDIIQPEIKSIGIEVSPISQLQNGYVNITCTITDNVAVDNVKVNITGPAGFTPLNVTMIRIVGTNNYYYNITFAIAGEYSYSIWANDTSGNEILSAPYQFVITIAYRETIESREVNVVGVWDGTITIESAVLSQPLPENLQYIGIRVNITITGALTYANITIRYNDSDVANINESKLKIYYWDGSQWQPCNNTGVDTDNNLVWANVTHLTIFAPMAEKVAGAQPAPVNLLLYTGISAIIVIIIAISSAVVVKKRKKLEGAE